MLQRRVKNLLRGDGALNRAPAVPELLEARRALQTETRHRSSSAAGAILTLLRAYRLSFASDEVSAVGHAVLQYALAQFGSACDLGRGILRRITADRQLQIDRLLDFGNGL